MAEASADNANGSPPAAADPSRLIAGHRVLRRLGTDCAGGFGLGSLWLAEDANGRPVAIKTASSDAIPAVLIKECNSHPCLVKLVGWWLVNEAGEIIRERPKDSKRKASIAVATNLHLGISIRCRLEECQKTGLPGIPQEELLTYCEQIASAVDYLRTPKLVSGMGMVQLDDFDVTPGDIDLLPECARLNDLHAGIYHFGTRMESSLVVFVGSPRYSPPESFRGPSTKRAGFSLAVTYHELRTGVFPFGDLPESMPDLIEARIDGRLDLSKLPEAESGVLRQTLSLDASARPGTCTELVRQLRRARH
jgi:serine/threonine protein kinase